MPSRVDANQNIPTRDQYAAAAEPVREFSTYRPQDIFESCRGSSQKACKYIGGAVGVALAGTAAVVGAVSLPVAIIGGALAVLLGVACGSAIGERLDKIAAKQATVAMVVNLVDEIVTKEELRPVSIFDALDSLDKVSDFYRADENDLQKVQDARARLTKKLAEEIDASQAQGYITEEAAHILKIWVMDVNAIDAKEQGGFGKNLGLLRLDLRRGKPMRQFVDDLLVRFRTRYTPDGLMTPLRRTERLKKAIRGDITETASIAESLAKHVKDAGTFLMFFSEPPPLGWPLVCAARGYLPCNRRRPTRGCFSSASRMLRKPDTGENRMKIDRKRHGQQTNDLDFWATPAQKKLIGRFFSSVLSLMSDSSHLSAF